MISRLLFLSLCLGGFLFIHGCSENEEKSPQETNSRTSGPTSPNPAGQQPPVKITRPPSDQPGYAELDAASGLLMQYMQAALKPEAGPADPALLDQAEEKITSALEVNRKDPEIIYTAALIAAKKGKYQDAIALIEEGIGYNEKFEKFHLGLGNLYLKTGQEEKARNSYQKAIKLFDEILVNSPDNPNIINKKAFAMLLMGDREGAISYLEEKIKTSPMPSILQRSLEGYKNDFSIESYLEQF